MIMSGWNAKVRCVEGGYSLKEGNVYNIVNGTLHGDNCYKTNTFTNIDDLNRKLAPQFELVCEEPPQPHKSMLKSGMKVVYRNGEPRYVLLETGTLHDKRGGNRNYLSNYSDELIQSCLDSSIRDIMEIWDGDKLIAKRVEKSKTQLEIEEIEKEIENAKDEFVSHTDKFNASMDKLITRLSELKEEVK